MKCSLFVNPGRVEETRCCHMMYFAIIYVCSSLVPSVLIRHGQPSVKSFFHSLFLLPDFKAFEEAAEHFQPYIKFFATFDKGVSMHRPRCGSSTTYFPEAQDVSRFNIWLLLLIFIVPLICGSGVHIWICPCHKIKSHLCTVEAVSDLGLGTSSIRLVGP